MRLLDVGAEGAELRVGQDRAHCPVPGGGEHRAMSMCAAAAVLVALGKPLDQLQRLAQLQVPQGRGNVLRIGTVSIIDESYNANLARELGS